MEADQSSYIQNKYNDKVTASQGYFVQVDYLFFPESWRDLFIFGDGSSLGISFRYGFLDIDSLTRGASNIDDTETYNIGFHIMPIRESIFRLEYIWEKRKIHHWRWNSSLLASFATYF